MPSPRWPRAVLAASVLAGLGSAVVFPAASPEQVALASDIYYAAARAVLAGQSPYADTGFLYPPPVVAAFLPHGLLPGKTAAFWFQNAVNAAALAGVAAIAVRLTERAGADLARRDRLLIGAFALASPLSVVNLVNGQINPVLALGIGAGVLALETDRDAAGGAAFGLVALVKLFPALVGAWLLRRRAWRAIAAATATGLGLLLAGLAVFGPGAYETYVTTVLTGEASVGTFAGGPNPEAPYATLRRQLALVAPSLSGGALLAVSLAIAAPVIAAANRSVATTTDRLVAVHATLAVTLLVFPLEPLYRLLHAVTLVPVLYALDGRPRRLFLAGAALVAVPIAYPDVITVTGFPVVPAALRAAVRAAARALFSVVLLPTLGAWLTIAGCLLHQHRAVGGTAFWNR
jgi:hypothetical protein